MTASANDRTIDAIERTLESQGRSLDALERIIHDQGTMIRALTRHVAALQEHVVTNPDRIGV
jgi:molybdopterin biosynthesis enzyme MoaB